MTEVGYLIIVVCGKNIVMLDLKYLNTIGFCDAYCIKMIFKVMSFQDIFA